MASNWVVALDPNFRKLSMEHIVSAYKRTTTRAILLDYDGTLMPRATINKSPSSKTVDVLNNLCRDNNNMVFIVCARSRKTLGEWFSACENLGIAAEHGCFLSLKKDADWETCVPVVDCSWKHIAEPVMKLYTETTDGSTIEDKETAMVRCYEDADPDFGSCQAKELLDHLESVLANEPVTVKSGQNIVEVKPQGPYINVADANEPPEGQKFQKRNTTEMASNGERLEHLKDLKPERVSDIVHNHQVCQVACYNHDEKILRSAISKK